MDEMLVDELQRVVEEQSAETRKVFAEKLQRLKDLIAYLQLDMEVEDELAPDMEEDPIDQYELGTIIAEACNGPIYEATDVCRGEVYALKMVSLDDNMIDQQLAKELVVLNDMRHANIVRLYKTFANFNSICLVMEYVGESLKEAITMNGSDNHEDTKRWLKQILCAVNYLHENNLIHRDLRLETIVLGDSQNIKLTDFATVRASFGGTILTPEVDTLVNRAPELLLGYEDYDEMVDLWSVGCIFVEMLEGMPPFEVKGKKKSESAVLHEIFKKLGKPSKESWLFNLPNFPRDMEEYPEASEITPKLDAVGNDLLLKLLSIDPTKRISAADALNHPYLVEE